MKLKGQMYLKSNLLFLKKIKKINLVKFKNNQKQLILKFKN